MLPFAHFNRAGENFVERISFTAHPASVGETYFEHMRSAAGFSRSMILGGVACMVHAIFPFLFTSTGSSVIRQLYERMVTKRGQCSTGEMKEV